MGECCLGILGYPKLPKKSLFLHFFHFFLTFVSFFFIFFHFFIFFAFFHFFSTFFSFVSLFVTLQVRQSGDGMPSGGLGFLGGPYNILGVQKPKPKPKLIPSLQLGYKDPSFFQKLKLALLGWPLTSTVPRKLTPHRGF